MEITPPAAEDKSFWILFPGGSDGKECAMWDKRVQSLGQEDPLEKGMATHSSFLVWRIPWTEESGQLQSMAFQSQTLLSDSYTLSAEECVW